MFIFSPRCIWWLLKLLQTLVRNLWLSEWVDLSMCCSFLYLLQSRKTPSLPFYSSICKTWALLADSPQEPLLATVKRWKLAWFWHVTCHDSLSRTFFKAPWRVGDAVVGRGSAGWMTSKSGHPCPCQICTQGPPAEKTGRGSLLNRPLCSLDYPIGQGTELNWNAHCFKALTWTQQSSPLWNIQIIGALLFNLCSTEVNKGTDLKCCNLNLFLSLPTVLSSPWLLLSYVSGHLTSLT